MKYLLMICADEAIDEAMTPDQLEPMMERWGEFHARHHAAILGGDRLRPTGTATTVRVRDGRTMLTDGPFAETKEQIGGYYLVEAPDLDAAVRIAAAIPSATYGSIEVRPVWPVEEYMPS